MTTVLGVQTEHAIADSIPDSKTDLPDTGCVFETCMCKCDSCWWSNAGVHPLHRALLNCSQTVFKHSLSVPSRVTGNTNYSHMYFSDVCMCPASKYQCSLLFSCHLVHVNILGTLTGQLPDAWGAPSEFYVLLF